MKSLKFLNMFILLVAYIAPYTNSYAQEFNVSYVSGHQYSYKPSLSQRLQGINEVVVIVPKSQSKVDQYYYTCITNYFKRLGVPTRTYSAHFNKEDQQIGTVQIVCSKLSEDISDCYSDANTLVVIADFVASFGGRFYYQVQN